LRYCFLPDSDRIVHRNAAVFSGTSAANLTLAPQLPQSGCELGVHSGTKLGKYLAGRLANRVF
jgi:hypothetical protein